MRRPIEATSAIGHFDKALADCNEALEQSPSHAPTLDSRGLVYFHMKDFKKAISDYDAALAVAPRQAASLYGRGAARLATGDKGGHDDIKAAIAIAPGINEEFAGYGVTAPESAQ